MFNTIRTLKHILAAMMLSSTGIVAVPSSADSWTDVTTFTVPAGVKRVKRVGFRLSPDFGTSATSIRLAPVFRLTGSGLLEQNPHEFLGNFGGLAAVTVGAAVVQDDGIYYDVDIPVSVGGTFTVQVNTLDEAITAGTFTAVVEYDDKEPVEKNSMSQYIDAALDTTADRWQEMGSGLTIPKTTEEKSPTRIKQIVIGVAPDQGTSAISLRIAVRIKLSGSGIKEGGDHEFMTKAAGNECVTDGIVAYSNMTNVIDVDIPINAGGIVKIEQRVDVETPTAGTIAIGLRYA